MSPRVLTARGHHSGKADGSPAVVFAPDPGPEPEYPTCEHPRTEPRIRTLSNGTLHYVVQCLDCGQGTRHLKKSEWELREAAKQNPPFDPSIAEDRRERWYAERAAWYERKNTAWWGSYSAYMASDAWWDRRCRRLELDAYHCQAKLPGCTDAAEQVHHLTYAHLGNEPLFELISVCTSCHDTITAMDRRRRGTL